MAPADSQGEPYASSRTYLAGAPPRQAWFLCDTLNTDRIFAIGLPKDGRVEVSAYRRGSATPPDVQAFMLGDASPGAGQIYWPLTGPNGADAGNLHAFNPGALDPPSDALTPTFTSVKIGGTDADCRWVTRTRLMGFSARRSFLIIQTPDGGLEYQTFDARDAASAKGVAPDGAQRSTTPSLDIKGGQETVDGFVFRNKGYAYAVNVTAPAAVLISRNGAPVATEPLIAWTVAPKP